MTIVLALLFLLMGTALLLWGADWFIDGVRNLAQYLGVSTLLLAIVLAGLEPEEMLTAALASAQGAGQLALGDVIGTNITIVTLALGLSAALVPIVLASNLRRQAFLAAGASAIPILLLLLLPIDRIVGFILLLLYAGYIYILWQTDRRAMAQTLASDDDPEKTNKLLKPAEQQTARRKSILLTLGGLIAMAIGGPLLVAGALMVTDAIGLGQEVVGSTIVALGTGAEMIALGISAARKRQADVLVGAVLGSFTYNLLVTLGLAALIRPLPGVTPALLPALWCMILLVPVLTLLVYQGRFSRTVGRISVGFYIVYLIIMIFGGAMLSFA